jgi:hypothetical protein
VFLSLCYAVVRWVARLAVLRLRSNDFKDLEILVLRHELGILRRRIPRPTISWTDGAAADAGVGVQGRLRRLTPDIGRLQRKINRAAGFCPRMYTVQTPVRS